MESVQPGDVLHFWTYVIWNGLGYHQEDGRFGIESNDGAEITSVTTLPSLDVRTDSTQSCVESMTRINGGPDIPCKGELIFEDNFDTVLDDTKWKIEQRFSTEPVIILPSSFRHFIMSLYMPPGSRVWDLSESDGRRSSSQ